MCRPARKQPAVHFTETERKRAMLNRTEPANRSRRSAQAKQAGAPLSPRLRCTVGSTAVYVLPGRSGFLFRSKMAIDADGAPNAYHPSNSRLALDYLGNAGQPGSWFGVVTDSGSSDGTPVVQGADDPFPGFCVSPTSLHDKSKARTDPKRYVDSTQVPYIALPRELKDHGLQLGDLALVVHCKTGALCAAVFADIGPRGKLGEGSVALAQALGVPSSPKNGGTDRAEILYLAFPGSSLGWPVPLDRMAQRATALFEAWGGLDQLRACFVDASLRGEFRLPRPAVPSPKHVAAPKTPRSRSKARNPSQPTLLSKVIVTNLDALRDKYGDQVAQVQVALMALARADEARGLTVRLLAIDSPRDMTNVKGKPARRGDARSAKQAIDAICKALQPEYVLIVGGPDVVPFVPLQNPCYKEDADEDLEVPSDLPYACSAGYSTDAARFLGPTRIVGRLPDLPGESNPRFLIKILNTAATWTERERAEYQRYFAISTDAWKKSTGQSITALFGSNADLKTIPPGGPDWAAEDLSRKLHFINCHGSPSDPQFYGQHGKQLPVAEKADTLVAKISPGTVVAAECCYGGQVYAPEDSDGQAGICLTYLENGAYAFLGSSTIAYGPSAGNGQADLLCQDFIRAVLQGGSTGRALIEARHRFAGANAHIDPVDLKTLAQFYLLGDPSIHPVKVAAHALVDTKTYQEQLGQAERHSRLFRRERITRTGSNLHRSLGSVVEHSAPPPAHVLRLLESAASEAGLQSPTHKSFTVQFPASAHRGELQPFRERRSHRSVHMTTGRVGDAQGKDLPRLVTLIATVEDGEVVHLRRVHSR